jgi:hypothetical protein
MFRLQGIAIAVKISRNSVKKYLRLIEVKGLFIDELLQMEDEAQDALLHDPDPQDRQRHESLAVLFPHFNRELGRTGFFQEIFTSRPANFQSDYIQI